jgi:hypothetical protein
MSWLVDDSQFTRTFANVLANNPDACVPIEKIVLRVISAVASTNQQTPQFGKISGFEDEDGTFFFMPKRLLRCNSPGDVSSCWSAFGLWHCSASNTILTNSRWLMDWPNRLSP